MIKTADKVEVKCGAKYWAVTEHLGRYVVYRVRASRECPWTKYWYPASEPRYFRGKVCFDVLGNYSSPNDFFIYRNYDKALKSAIKLNSELIKTVQPAQKIISRYKNKLAKLNGK